jgi:hypothetical protein
MAPPAVTPTGVRDGDPDAFAGLCAARGDAVLAYCEKVAGNAASATAAAEAFGRFRATVVATADLAALNPEEVLVNATRQAAARHGAGHAEGICGDVPLLLASRADRSISISDLERLESHLESCWACRAPVARFKAAERAYRDPPGRPVAPDVAEAIIAALAAAAPVRGREPEPVPRSADRLPVTEHVPAITDSVGPDTSDDATAEHRELDDDLYQGPADHDVLPSSNGSRRDRHGIAASALARLRFRRDGAQMPATTATASVPEPRPVAGRQLPRPQRGPESAPPGLYASSGRPPVLLPVALIAFALIIALLVAGVFSGGEPASSQQSPAPAVEPKATGKTPKVVVVPGAKEATAAAVERAKQRARAERRRDAEVARQPAPVATQGASAPTLVAPAPVTPPAAVNAPRPPAPPPSPAADNASQPTRTPGRGGPRVGTDNGATGSDQLPAPDTSSVPELAPPDDTALPPG